VKIILVDRDTGIARPCEVTEAEFFTIFLSGHNSGHYIRAIIIPATDTKPESRIDFL
jgi:hypothetical protein